MDLFGPTRSAYEKFLDSGNISFFYKMDDLDLFVVTAYFVILSILSFYGLHRYMMVFLFPGIGQMHRCLIWQSPF